MHVENNRDHGVGHFSHFCRASSNDCGTAKLHVCQSVSALLFCLQWIRTVVLPGVQQLFDSKGHAWNMESWWVHTVSTSIRLLIIEARADFVGRVGHSTGPPSRSLRLQAA